MILPKDIDRTNMEFKDKTQSELVWEKRNYINFKI